MAIIGTVFDVSAKKEMYGPGGGYSVRLHQFVYVSSLTSPVPDLRWERRLTRPREIIIKA